MLQRETSMWRIMERESCVRHSSVTDCTMGKLVFTGRVCGRMSYDAKLQLGDAEQMAMFWRRVRGVGVAPESFIGGRL